jgi:hypothetical protein
MQRLNGAELSNVLHSLMRLGHPVSEPFVAASLRAFRATYGTSCTAPALARFLYAVAKLGVSARQSRVLTGLVCMPPFESPFFLYPSLPVTARACPQSPLRFTPPFPLLLSSPPFHPSSTPKVRPSFNWMAASLAEARRLIDMLTARELAALLWSCVKAGHTPDQVFMEIWFR